MKSRLLFVVCFFALSVGLLNFKKIISNVSLSKKDERESSRKKASPKEGLCARLQNIPSAQSQGVVKHVKRMHLKEIKNPYNASITHEGDGYILVFRYDVVKSLPDQQGPCYSSNIAAVRLNKNFDQTSSVTRVDTQSFSSQDPRIIRRGDELFLSYNDVEKNAMHSRQMRLAKVDARNFSLSEMVDLDLNIKPVEKNWVPFVHKDVEGKEMMYFGYNFNPHKILCMQDTAHNRLEHLVFPSVLAYQRIPWENIWGEIRGGTPAMLLDGQYLAFFHSSFKEDKKKWYVMGAYTFEKNPPFRITSISEYPILFDGIYDSPAENTSSAKLRCIFPSGFVIEQGDEGDVIHLSCGENDCSVKIVTLDKAQLIKSLLPIPLSTE